MKLNLHKLHSYICPDGAEYYATQPGFKTAWQNCERADWMLYIIKRLNISSQKTALCAGRIAETVQYLMKDTQSIAAVKGAINYGEGKIDMAQLGLLNIAAKASVKAAKTKAAIYAAKTAAEAEATIYAAVAAAETTAKPSTKTIAETTTYAAATAAAAAIYYNAYDNAVYNAHDDDYAANAADYAYTAFLKTSSDICREILTEEVFAAIDKLENNS